MKPILFTLLLIPLAFKAQVGVGTTTPSSSSILDIYSNNKGLLIPRIPLINSTDTTTISGGNVLGLTVFNNISQNDVTIGYYYWDGAKWMKLATSSGGSATVNATNGLNQLSNGDVVLGGTLNTPTTITTSAINTLSIKGLQAGNNAVDEMVSIDPTTGKLSKLALSSTAKQQQVIYNATNGQAQFTTPSNFTDIDKISVYRNGAIIASTAVNSTTIALESGVVCDANDQIRIIQLN